MCQPGRREEGRRKRSGKNRYVDERGSGKLVIGEGKTVDGEGETYRSIRRALRRPRSYIMLEKEEVCHMTDWDMLSMCGEGN